MEWQGRERKRQRDCEAGARYDERCILKEKLMYRIPLVFTPQPEGGYTVTCPVLPELQKETH